MARYFMQQGVIISADPSWPFCKMFPPAHFDVILRGIVVFGNNLVGEADIGLGVGDDPFHQGVIDRGMLVSGDGKVTLDLLEVPNLAGSQGLGQAAEDDLGFWSCLD